MLYTQMSLIKYNPKHPARGFGQLFDDFFTRGLTDVFGSDFAMSSPSVNVVEHNDRYNIELAAPGLDKADFDVKADKDLLTITAKKEQKEEVKEEKYYRKEFNYSSFSRSFQIPDTVDASAIAASYENGVLVVSLPKKEETDKEETTRVIDIK